MNVFYVGWLLLVPLYLLWREKRRLERGLREENILLQKELSQARIEKVEIAAKLEEREKVRETREGLIETFKIFSMETLEKFQMKSEGEMNKRDEALLKILEPVKQNLHKLDNNMREIEKERIGDRESLKEQIRSILESEKGLREETEKLVKSLRRPEVRGVWGELQLKRVVELSGMVNHCDFYEQKVAMGEESKVRPDLVVKLPGGKHVVIDAKASLDAFLEANASEDASLKEEKLKDHARIIRGHIQQLGKKSYWQSFQPSPEFVILFLPAEIFFSAALQYDPLLIEFAAQNSVILATPTTLIGLLRSIAYGWKEDTFSRHAKEIQQLGHELHKRLSDMSKHWQGLGRALSQAIDGYNRAMGTFEKRVLVSARKLKDWGAGQKEIDLEEMGLVENNIRTIDVSEEDKEGAL